MGIKSSRTLRRCEMLLLFSLLSIADIRAQTDEPDPTPPTDNQPVNQTAPLSAEERQALIQQSRTALPKIQLLVKQHDYKAAESQLQEFLSWQRKLGYENSRGFVSWLKELAYVQTNLGKFDVASDNYSKAIDLSESLLGKDHWQTIDAQQSLAACKRLEAMGPAESEEYLKATRLLGAAYEDETSKLPDALQEASQAVEIFSRLIGADEYVTARAMLAQGNMLRLSKQFDQAATVFQRAAEIFQQRIGLNNPYYAGALAQVGRVYISQGHTAEALPQTKLALEIFQKTMGPSHFETINCASDMVAIYQAEGDFKSALPLAQAVVEATDNIGSRHIEIPFALQRLADIYADLGNYSAARDCAERGLRKEEQKLGSNNPALVPSILCLARALNKSGEYSTAEPLYKRAVDIDQKSFGPNSKATAESLLGQADFYHGIGNDVTAWPIFQQALKACESENLKDSLPHAAVLEGIAQFYLDQHDAKNAKMFYQQALAIREKIVGPDDFQIAKLLDRMARVDILQKDYVSAQAETQRALKIQATTLQKQNPAKADSLLLLGLAQQKQGDFASAKTSFQRAIIIDEEVFGADYLLTSTALNDLVKLYLMQGNAAAALPLARLSLQGVEKWLDSRAIGQSERQQILLEHHLRLRLDNFVTAALATHADTADIYQQVLLWKGYLFLKQRSISAARQALDNDPAVLELFNDLQAKARALSNAYNALQERKVPTMGNEQLFLLSQELETAQRKLAEKTRQNSADEKHCTLADLQQAVPEKTALVDVLEYLHIDKLSQDHAAAPSHRSLIAFIVRPDKQIQLVDLGPSEPIDQAVSRWRKTELPRERELVPSAKTPAEKPIDNFISFQTPGWDLRQQVWEKLTPYLDGCETVLVSPDGALMAMAWGALPGKQPGHFLLEEMPIVVIPVPQMLPQLLAKPVANQSQQGQPSLLVVGNVDLYADPGRPEVHPTPQIPPLDDHKLDNFGSLPTTKAQIAEIRDRFAQSNRQGTITELTGNQPTEQTIRDFVPVSSFVHFAAHGYYLPSTIDKDSKTEAISELPDDKNPSIPDVTQLQPELLSGICLAGMYRYVQPDKDDGRLTALEVKTMNLDSVEMVSLCSCQTALGASLSGEGMFGLQRAFQEAGARTTVTTLWSIPVATSDPLMVEFYDNLWIKKMSRIEALRQAQIKIMREGVQYLHLSAQIISKFGNRPLPPFFWGAFVLAGDWR
jgi:CHAT domain-containing protein